MSLTGIDAETKSRLAAHQLCHCPRNPRFRQQLFFRECTDTASNGVLNTSRAARPTLRSQSIPLPPEQI